MSQRVFGCPPAGTPEWHAWRAGGIGASDWASVCPDLGVDYGCQRRAAYEKSGTPRTETEVDSGPMRRGRYMEPLIRQVLAERWSYEVFTLEEMRERHPEVLQVRGGLPDWWLGTPDAFVRDAEGRWGVAELKCPSPYHLRHMRHEGVPTAWVIQPQHYLYTFPACTFGVLCLMEPVDLDAEHVRVEVDLDLIQQLLRRGQEFMDNLRPGEGTPKDIGHDKCRECPWQSRCYRDRGLADEVGAYRPAKGRPLPAEATAQVEEAYLRWSGAKLAAKAAEGELDAAKGALAALLGESADVEIPGQQVRLTTKRSASRRFNTERFKAAHPKLYEEFRALSLGEVGVREVSTEEGI